MHHATRKKEPRGSELRNQTALAAGSAIVRNEWLLRRVDKTTPARGRNPLLRRRGSATLAGLKSGTFNFWIDPEGNREAFHPGMRRRWAKFQIGEQTCVICSDGPSLAATINMGTANEAHLFRIAFAPSLQRRHMVTIGWKKGRLRVFLDSKPIADVALP